MSSTIAISLVFINQIKKGRAGPVPRAGLKLKAQSQAQAFYICQALPDFAVHSVTEDYLVL